MQRKMIIAAVVIGLAVVYFFVAGSGVRESELSTAKEPAAIAMAPDFSLTDMQGESVSLSEYRGKVVFLNFWASWCPPCKEEMPSMESLYQGLKEGDFVMLAVNVEENGKEAVAQFLKEVPVNFPILLDSTQAVANLYKVRGLPHTFIIDREGNMVDSVTGALDWNAPEVVRYISSLMTAR
ncbi:TlpA disulfide reductase family protein [Desulfuromonas sp. AOP6]|uniref:TlpA disulfide reductase family protein n=1 Tax=Desulfuromonas sp. AOP6 TaxID=1566351 RepID=UPI00126A8963|nr:TlpA disulfide reductase family protein [Desulfuromonas sp. AOP6]BCA81025.1 thioredoxin [Desulfuromonas sp. AOP6]